MLLTPPFGQVLRQLRKRVGMTQRDLAAALGYSDSLISSLEKGQRQPDLEVVVQRFVPALGLQDDTALASRLIEVAAAARGEALPAQHRGSASHEMAREMGTQGRHRVPALPIQVIGRNESIHQLGNRLLGHGGRLMTLVGPPGVGKTTLALAVAGSLQGHFPAGALFVPLAAVSESLMMAAAIITALAPGDASIKTPPARLVELLRRQHILLVLDNLEQIDGAAPLIAQLLAECPNVCILATSRSRLHLRAEQRFYVPPLDVEAAVQLFAQRAQAVQGSFQITEFNRSTLAAICTRLDCLPLALELAAAQVELFPSAQLLAQLQAHPLNLLVDGAHDLPPHQRTLRAAIQRSYDLLGGDEQRLLRHLGVFVGGFALAAVEEIGTGERESETGRSPQSPVSSLRSLIAKSLVRAETLADGEQRFFLLETIREFTLEQLRAQGEEEAACQRHYEIYLSRFRSADSHLRGPNAPVWFTRLQAEHDNLRAAIQWALDEARHNDVAWMIVAANWFWEYSNCQYEANQWLLPLIPHFHTLVPDLRLAIWIILNAYGDYTVEASRMLKSFAGEGMALLAISSQPLLQSAAWQVIADKTAELSRSTTARECAITLARSAADSSGSGSVFCLLADRDFLLGFALWRYALVLTEFGEFAQANSLASESLVIFQRQGNRYEQAGGLGTLGLLALLQGNLSEAHGLLADALDCATLNNTQWMICYWQPFLGLTTLYGGDAPTGHRLLIESWNSCIELKRKHLLPRICIYLAETALWEGATEEAERWLAECVGYRADPQRLGSAMVNCLYVAASLAAARQEYRDAAMLLGLAEETRLRAHSTLVEPVRAQVDATLATVQAALDPATFAEAFAAGGQMTLTDTFATLLVQTSP